MYVVSQTSSNDVGIHDKCHRNSVACIGSGNCSTSQVDPPRRSQPHRVAATGAANISCSAATFVLPCLLQHLYCRFNKTIRMNLSLEILYSSVAEAFAIYKRITCISHRFINE